MLVWFLSRHLHSFHDPIWHRCLKDYRTFIKQVSVLRWLMCLKSNQMFFNSFKFFLFHKSCKCLSHKGCKCLFDWHFGTGKWYEWMDVVHFLLHFAKLFHLRNCVIQLDVFFQFIAWESWCEPILSSILFKVRENSSVLNLLSQTWLKLYSLILPNFISVCHGINRQLWATSLSWVSLLHHLKWERVQTV